MAEWFYNESINLLDLLKKFYNSFCGVRSRVWVGHNWVMYVFFYFNKMVQDLLERTTLSVSIRTSENYYDPTCSYQDLYLCKRMVLSFSSVSDTTGMPVHALTEWKMARVIHKETRWIRIHSISWSGWGDHAHMILQEEDVVFSFPSDIFLEQDRYPLGVGVTFD